MNSVSHFVPLTNLFYDRYPLGEMVLEADVKAMAYEMSAALLGEGILHRRDNELTVIGSLLLNDPSSVLNREWNPEACFFQQPIKAHKPFLEKYRRFFELTNPRFSIAWLFSEYLPWHYPFCEKVVLILSRTSSSDFEISPIKSTYDCLHRELRLNIESAGKVFPTERVSCDDDKENDRWFLKSSLKMSESSSTCTVPFNEKWLGHDPLLQTLWREAKEDKNEAGKFIERLCLLAGTLTSESILEVCAVGFPLKSFVAQDAESLKNMHHRTQSYNIREFLPQDTNIISPQVLPGVLWFVYEHSWEEVEVSGERLLLDDIARNRLQPLASRLQSCLLTLQSITRRKAETRAAAASILARNMSHNIGSHVIPRSETELVYKRLTELYTAKGGSPPTQMSLYEMTGILKDRLDYYIQRKADFIAEVTTQPFYSNCSALFFKEVMAGFLGNTLLIDNIAATEGLGYHKVADQSSLRIHCFWSNRSKFYKALFDEVSEDPHAPTARPTHFLKIFIPYGWRNPKKRYMDLALTGTKDDSADDVPIALPGPLGECALYAFLENMIRNAAKHNDKKLRALRRKNKKENDAAKLKIDLILNDHPRFPDDFYQLSIVDHLSNCLDASPAGCLEKCLVTRLRHEAAKPLIDKSGNTRRESWGLAEMMICANLLAGSDDFQYNEENLKIESGKKGELIYLLRLMKPKRIAVIGSVLHDHLSYDQKEMHKSRGIIFFSDLPEFRKTYSNQSGSRASFIFVLAAQDILPEKANDKQSLYQLSILPFRVIEVDTRQKSNGKMENGRLRIRDNPLEDKPDPDSFIQILWEIWLRRWLDESSVSLNIYLGQLPEERETRFWREKAKSFNPQTDLKCLINILDRNLDFPMEVSDKPQRIWLDRHSLLIDKIGKLTARDSHINIDKANPDFVKIFQPPTSSPWTFPYELIEAGLLRVLILDERVAERAFSPSDETGRGAHVLTGMEGFAPLYWHVALHSRVWIATHLKTDGEEEPLHELSYNDGLRKYKNYSKKDAGLLKATCPKLCLDLSDVNKPCIIRHYINEEFNKEDNTKKIGLEDAEIDMVVIHQSIIDKFPEALRNEKIGIIHKLRRHIPWIVFESGRGLPPEIQNNYEKFLPFSALNYWLKGKRVAKLSMAQTLMSLNRTGQKI